MVQIESVRIRNYRSIIDSGEIDIDSGITRLVGPNEAGKSNFLEALQSVRTDIEYKKDDLTFYADQSNLDTEETPIVTMTISEAPLDMLDIYTLRLNIDKDLENEKDTVVIKKFYDGSYEVKLQNNPGLIQKIKKEQKNRVENKIQSIYSKYKDLVNNINREMDEPLGLPSPFSIRRIPDDISGRNVQNRIENIIDRLEEIQDDFENDQVNLSNVDNEIQEVKERLASIQTITQPVAEDVVDNFYNSAFKKGADLIQDEVPVENLEDHNIDTFYSDILRLAEIEPSLFYSMDSKTRYDKKQKAADRLEQGFNEYWPREDNVNFEISFGGDTVSLHITDETGSTDLTTHRSTGFRHFLSFYIRLISSSGEDLVDNLLLLDGPGIHLHPEGQKKLKEALQNLAEDNQVVYSTHSPFMIDADHVEQIRIIRQDIENGTQIISDLDKAAQKDTEVDVLAPVRTSIGANFADSLFASSANILVEGYTDKRYIETLSKYFKRKGNNAAISYETNIITFDGTKADYLAKILDAEGYEYVILLDNDSGGETRKESLIDRGIAENNTHILGEHNDNINTDQEITMEDLFSERFYGEQVVETHDEIDMEDIEEIFEQDSGKLVKRIEDRLNELEGREQIENGTFSKADVADHISDRVTRGEYDRSDLGNNAIHNFDKLIEALNKKVNK